MLNFSSLLNSSVESPTFLGELDLTAPQTEFISRAKAAIRACLRDNLPAALRAAGHTENTVNPRFFTQGSASYKTLNGPAQAPQQADIDDGVYLPLSFVTSTGTPSTAASVFFAAAEQALENLVADRRWRLLKDKATCLRVEIATFAHIDIPLYAIPDKEFATLEKAAQARLLLDSVGAEFGDLVEVDVWEHLPDNSVLLAHRQENWKKSDPRPIRVWFLARVEQHGEQFRRVVRYLKAYRDWRWPTGGPSSILIMAAAAKFFTTIDRRDDLALTELVETLPAVLRGGVDNPTDQQESLTDRLGEKDVEEAALAFTRLGQLLRRALAAEPQEACQVLIAQFGPRFPNDPSRIKNYGGPTATGSATFASAVAPAGYTFPNVSAAPTKPRGFA